jgi:hypothetical protein
MACGSSPWLRTNRPSSPSIVSRLVIFVTSSPSCAVLSTSQISLALFNPCTCCLCLGVKSRALVLNAMAENLDPLKWWWLGVFRAPTTKPTVGVGLLSIGAPDSPVRQPRHPTIRVLTVSTVGALTSWCTGQVLFTVRCASSACSDFSREL